jgi:HEPN superfamily Swt1-like protein
VKTYQERLQLMHMSVRLLHSDLEEVATKYGIVPITDSSSLTSQEQDEESYYLQYPAALRKQAELMSHYYRIFYCLENSIRDLVASQLEESYGENWWSDHVPENIKISVQNNKQREQDNGVTLRSINLIDYTTFGELSEIIKSNFDIFGATFNSKKALEKVMASLNLLRGPIAHCTALAEDEILRLHLTVRSFNRLME